MPIFVVAYHQEHPSVTEAIYTTSKTKEKAKKNAINKLDIELGTGKYTIISIKEKSGI